MNKPIEFSGLVAPIVRTVTILIHFLINPDHMMSSKNTLNFYVFFLALFFASPSYGDGEPADLIIRWENLDANLAIGKLGFYPANSFLRSELCLLKFKLEDYNLSLKESSTLLSKPRGLVKEMVINAGAVAGINANFFDPSGSPLGLMIPSTREANKKIQLGGKLLTGIFFIKDGLASILPRSDLEQKSISLALQAGPILYLKGLRTKFNSPSQTSRRSGLALTKSGEIIMFATLLRFPGTSLEDIQEVLSKTGLEISDALNLDGGGSSQLYVRPINGQEEISISGGDEIPVVLVVEQKVK